MLELETLSGRPGKMSRRGFLQAGFLGIGGLSLANLLELKAKSSVKPVQSDTAVILLWCGGGPSQLETYDMKPEAPSEIRGPMRPIKTNVSGIDVCELLPLHAQMADKFSLIRSVSHGSAGHPDGTFRFTSGFGQDKVGGMLATESKHPCLTAVVNRALGITRNGMPVSLDLSSGYRWYGSPGYWGEMYRVPVASRGLENWRLQIQPGQMEVRRSLLAQFDRLRTDLDHNGNLEAVGYFQQQAAEILLSNKAHEAFDVSKEDPRLRDRYGVEWGEQCLIARRLVERGVNLVTVAVPGRAPGSLGKNYDWDDHAVNWDLIEAMRDRLPFYDRTVSTLIEDLHQRGLNKKVLLLVTGEFGRTPRVDNNSPGRFGRDHYPAAMSMLISGGSGPLGSVIGATNSKAEYPTDRPLSPDDIRATLMRHLGIDYTQEFPDNAGRPLPLCYGRHLAEWA
ncbi:MAG: hypothetical protein JWN70_6021 [Planctomycetaceae bacterium]|nr:hypothetical protein [Planctomycetaceae bacterium]